MRKNQVILSKKTGEQRLKLPRILEKSVQRSIIALKSSPDAGIHIPRKQIPKCYRDDFEIDNLWKINLPQAWRLIYTIRSTEEDIICLIIDILDHKKYERRFKY